MSKRRKMLVVVVEYLIVLIESREYLLASRQSEKDFTRRRKMSFTNYIWYLLTMAKRSLTSGLQAFVKELNVSWDSYSKQAFSQGRQRIKPEAIKALMSATQERFYQEANYATWKGMRVLAIDGSRYNLPTSEELREHYGIQKSSGEQVQALGSCLYDVLNGLVLDAQLTRVDGNAGEAAFRRTASQSGPTRGEGIAADGPGLSLLRVDQGDEPQGIPVRYALLPGIL